MSDICYPAGVLEPIVVQTYLAELHDLIQEEVDLRPEGEQWLVTPDPANGRVAVKRWDEAVVLSWFVSRPYGGGILRPDNCSPRREWETEVLSLLHRVHQRLAAYRTSAPLVEFATKEQQDDMYLQAVLAKPDLATYHRIPDSSLLTDEAQTALRQCR